MAKPKRLYEGGGDKRAKARKKKKGKQSSSKGKSVVLSLLIGLVMVGLGAIFYMFVLPFINSSGPEPKAAISMVTKLRAEPSSEEGVTVGERMNQEIERSRRVGNLTSYKGWTTKPIKGTKTRFMIVFSYDEQGDVKQTAEWIADLSTGTFTPTNELAAAVYKK